MTTTTPTVSTLRPEGSRDYKTDFTTTQTCTNSVAAGADTAIHYYTCFESSCSFWKWSKTSLTSYPIVAKPTTMPVDASTTNFASLFSTGTARTVAITASSEAKWDTAAKVATDIQTVSETIQFTALTKEALDLLKKAADLAKSVSTTASTAATTTPTAPVYTVVSGLQFIQTGTTLSPVKVGSQTVASSPDLFASKAAFEAKTAAETAQYAAAATLVASGVVAAVAALAF